MTVAKKLIWIFHNAGGIAKGIAVKTTFPIVSLKLASGTNIA